MPRRLRLTVPKLPHLIMHRGHNGCEVFRTRDDHEVFLHAMADTTIESGCALHAYALLPDRVLMLCTPARQDSTVRMMQCIGRRYARHFNNSYARSGALWDGRFRQCVVQPLGPTLSAYRYVDGAAKRAGLASRADSYRWSSAAAHSGLRGGVKLNDDPAFLALGRTPGERVSTYRGLLETPLGGKLLADVDTALYTSLVLGGERFKDDLERELRRPMRVGRPGRPPGQPAGRRDIRPRSGPPDTSGSVGSPDVS